MKKQISRFVCLLLSMVFLAASTLIFAGPAPANLPIISQTLSDLTAGNTVTFGGHTWVVLDPAEGYLLMQGSSGSMPFDSAASNTVVFDPTSSTNIGNYLNFTFSHSFSIGEQSLILDHRWTTGANDGNGNNWESSTSTAPWPIGLLSYSELVAYHNYIPGYSGWLRTPYAVLWHSSPWVCEANGTLTPEPATGSFNVDPVLYLDPKVPIISGAVTAAQTATPTINTPIYAGATSVSGTAPPLALIYLGELGGQADPIGNWTISNLQPLQANGTVSVTARASGEMVSQPATATVVAGQAPAPTVVSAATDTAGGIIMVAFSKAMAVPPGGPPAGFSVTVGGAADAVTGVGLDASGSKYRLTLATAVQYGQTVTLAYTPGSVQSADTGVLAAFTNQAVTNNVPQPAVQPPSVTGISPGTGPAAGGTMVTITGTNFTPGATVLFGNSAATGVIFNSAASITATSPAGTGTVDVTVTTPGGTSAAGSADQFTYTQAPPVTGQTVMRFYIGNADYYVNNQVQSMDTVPIISGNRTLLPIRYVATPLGATVAWDQGAQMVTVSLNGKTIVLWIGRNTAQVNGVTTPIDPNNPDVAPIVVPPGRTMLPLRFIAENLGAQVDWNQAQQMVTVTYPKP